MNALPVRSQQQPRPFLGVNFAACRVYGRLYKNRDGTAYEGRCPRCGKGVRVPIGAQGTAQRFFIVDCGP
jgi:PHP family Zn ribbon phosphoesterase